MKLKGTQEFDKKLMDEGLKEFKKKAKKKFMDGIKEHNPNGDKGMCMMSMKDRVSSAKEEVMDLWFYLCSIESAVDQTRLMLVQEGLAKPKTYEEWHLYFERTLGEKFPSLNGKA